MLWFFWNGACRGVKMIRQLIAIALLISMPLSALPGNIRYELRVDGLACPFCAYGIEKQLQKLDGVARVDTDIEEGRVIIRMEDGKSLDRAEVEQAVKKAGFSLRSFEQPEGMP